MSRIYKKAFITGATRGIGLSLALALAERGTKLILSGRETSQVKQLLPDAEIVECDLSKKEERQKLFQSIKTCDLWINNAGFGLYGTIDTLSIDEIDAMIEVNATSVAESTHYAIKSFQQENIQGTVLNIASAAPFFVTPQAALYTATKAFVLSLSESLDFEWKKEGIRILASCPGVVDTDFQKTAARGKEKRNKPLSMQLPEVTAKILKQLDQEKRVSIINWKYHLLATLQQFLPKSLSANTVDKNI